MNLSRQVLFLALFSTFFLPTDYAQSDEGFFFASGDYNLSSHLEVIKEKYPDPSLRSIITTIEGDWKREFERTQEAAKALNSSQKLDKNASLPEDKRREQIRNLNTAISVLGGMIETLNPDEKTLKKWGKGDAYLMGGLKKTLSIIRRNINSLQGDAYFMRTMMVQNGMEDRLVRAMKKLTQDILGQACSQAKACTEDVREGAGAINDEARKSMEKFIEIISPGWPEGKKSKVFN
ncbi:MAG: hypothetical protein OXB88_10885 [Bacteriovoracales bacterium]|nr:hypothetical protein [Bacteriovoracales bacterium]